jgi:signal transduction histidine kinase
LLDRERKAVNPIFSQFQNPLPQTAGDDDSEQVDSALLRQKAIIIGTTMSADLKQTQLDLKNVQLDLKSSQLDLKSSQIDLKSSQVDLKDSQSDLKDSQSDLKSSQSDLKNSQSDLKSSQSDLKESQSDLKNSQSNLKNSQSDLKSSQSNLKSSQSDLKSSQSDLKSSQSDLKNSQSDLKGSQQESYNRLLELEVLYQTAPVGLGFLDHELRYVRLNEALAEINELPAEAHIGRYASEINPVLAQIVVPIMAKVLASRQPRLNVEIQGNRRADLTHQRTWMVNFHPLNNNETLGVSVVFQDITQQKRAQTALLRSNEELRQFAFAAAHDLQEPLRNISLYAQLLNLQYKRDMSEGDDEYLTSIIKSARRMQTLIRDLLEYTDVVDLRDEPGLPVDCNTACRTALDNLALALEECQADVGVAPLPTVVAENAHVIQLFQNLIGNAVKYRAKERHSEIHVSADRRDDHWIFSIKDNGIGIAPEYHERIFGVFKRLHGREVPGTGIGLAICKRIVEHHGGRLWLESEVGQGSTFHFSVPDTN